MIINLFTLLIIVITFECLMWGWTLQRHAKWVNKYIKDRRVSVNYHLFSLLSIMSSVHCIMLWVWWLLLYAKMIEISIPLIFCALMILIMLLIHLHYHAIIARFTCLPRSLWPLLSKLISIIICKYSKLNPPVLTIQDLQMCWRHENK